MIIYSSKIVPNGFIGITLYPFILLKDSKADIIAKKGLEYHVKLINHEKIHLRQQLELLVIPFYLFYVLNWFINLFTSFTNAYKRISFEREAKANESNMNYLKSRMPYSWLKHLISKNK